MFMAHGKKIFNSRQARDGFYRAVSTRAFANLYPQARFNPATGLFDLSLRAYPKSPWSVGLGGYITSSTNSMLYAAIGFNSLGNTMADASLGAWIGQNYAAAHSHTRIPDRYRLWCRAENSFRTNNCFSAPDRRIS